MKFPSTENLEFIHTLYGSGATGLVYIHDLIRELPVPIRERKPSPCHATAVFWKFQSLKKEDSHNST